MLGEDRRHAQPQAHQELSTNQVLAMDFEEGITLSQWIKEFDLGGVFQLIRLLKVELELSHFILPFEELAKAPGPFLESLYP